MQNRPTEKPSQEAAPKTVQDRAWETLQFVASQNAPNYISSGLAAASNAAATLWFAITGHPVYAALAAANTAAFGTLAAQQKFGFFNSFLGKEEKAPAATAQAAAAPTPALLTP